MATNNNLNDFFTDIADAIRSKQTYSAANFRADVQKDFCNIPMSDNFANQVLNRWKENPTYSLLVFDNAKYASSGYVFFDLANDFTIVEDSSCTIRAPFYTCYIQRYQWESAWGDVSSDATINIANQEFKNYGHYADHIGVRTALQTATTPEGWIERMKLVSGITLSAEQAAELQRLWTQGSWGGQACYPVWCTHDNNTKIFIALIPSSFEYGHIYPDSNSLYYVKDINRIAASQGYVVTYNINSDKVIQGTALSASTICGVQGPIGNIGTAYSDAILSTKLCPRDFATIILNL